MPSLVFAALAVPVAFWGTRAPETAVLVGTVATAVSRVPIGGAFVVVDGTDSVKTDASGRFSIRAPRAARHLAIRGAGYRGFEYPILSIVEDTLVVSVELRTDPPSASSYAAPNHLPFLCVIRESKALMVANACDATLYPSATYTRQIIKHNPWSLYFGPAGDQGGVMLLSKAR